MRNKFINPSNAEEYSWPINHSEEGEAGLQRSITRGANTAGTGLVRQQADDQPFIFTLTGTILTKDQLEKMKDWYILCASQTIYFEKYDGDKFEVVITDFKPSQKKTIHNPKDPSIPLWYWTYSITMEVVTVIDGVWEDIVT